MARFTLVNLNGCILPWALRLQEEDHEVRLVNAKQGNERVGEGLVPVVPLSEALRDPSDWIWVWDFVTYEHGVIADYLRRAGIPVIGCGLRNAVLEEDRYEAEEIARSVGIPVPETVRFGSPSEAAEYVRENGGRWVWKQEGHTRAWTTYVSRSPDDMVAFLSELAPEGPGVLQRYVEGVALSTSFWFDGEEIVAPLIGMVEDKRFQPGVNAGSAVSWVWAYEDFDHVWDAMNLDAVQDMLSSLEFPPGEYDVNCQYDGERFWFLEWGPRLGWDEDVVYLPMFRKLGDHLVRLVNRELPYLDVETGRLHVGVRVSIPPYPHTEGDRAADVPYRFPAHGWDEPGFYPYDGRYERGRWYTCGKDGCVGVMVDADPSEVAIPQAQYRTDPLSVLHRGRRYVTWMP